MANLLGLSVLFERTVHAVLTIDLKGDKATVALKPAEIKLIAGACRLAAREQPLN